MSHFPGFPSGFVWKTRCMAPEMHFCVLFCPFQGNDVNGECMEFSNAPCGGWCSYFHLKFGEMHECFGT